jgi:molybdate transport system substrate-binding protein
MGGGARRVRLAAAATGSLLAGLAALTGFIGLTGCGQDGAGGGDGSGAGTGAVSGTVTVFAAASLTESFTALGRRFEAAHPGAKVRFSFGGSSGLARQIGSGAPADVFAAASETTMRQVVDAGAVEGTPAIFARNRLQIAVRPGNPARVAALADLARPGVKVALCAPQVPCGQAAVTVQRKAGVTIAPVTLEQDVKAALTKVKLGEVDAALVYRTDVRAAGAAVTGVAFAESAGAVNTYPVAALARAPNPAGATAFIRYVRSAAGGAALAGAGFESP